MNKVYFLSEKLIELVQQIDEDLGTEATLKLLGQSVVNRMIKLETTRFTLGFVEHGVSLNVNLIESEK